MSLLIFHQGTNATLLCHRFVLLLVFLHAMSNNLDAVHSNTVYAHANFDTFLPAEQQSKLRGPVQWTLSSAL